MYRSISAAFFKFGFAMEDWRKRGEIDLVKLYLAVMMIDEWEKERGGERTMHYI